MIKLRIGVAGSGKTYSAVKDDVIPALKIGRSVYHNIDGLLDDDRKTGRLKHILEVNHLNIRKIPDYQIIRCYEVVSNDPGCLVVIDEAQNFFGVGQKSDEIDEFFRWATEHRHLNIDIVLLTQHQDNIVAKIRRLVALTIRYRKAWILGAKNSYIMRSYEGDGGSNSVPIDSAGKIRRYDKNIFRLYKSTTVDWSEKNIGTKSIFRSPWWFVAGTILLFTGYRLIKGGNPITNMVGGGKTEFTELKKNAELENIKNGPGTYPVPAPKLINQDVKVKIISWPQRRVMVSNKVFRFEQLPQLLDLDVWLNSQNQIVFGLIDDDFYLEYNFKYGLIYSVKRKKAPPDENGLQAGVKTSQGPLFGRIGT